MATILDSSVTAPELPSRRRRAWPLVIAGAVVVALLSAGTAAVVYAHTYQPLTFGGGFGPATRNLPYTWDGISDTRLILVGPAGTTGVVDYTARNNGRHAIKLLGLQAGQQSGVSGLKWSNLSLDNPGGGAEQGLVSQARSFPVTLQPGEAVFLQLTVVQPTCPAGIDLEITGFPLRWSAFGVHHVWWDDVTGGANGLPISLCPPKSALTHIDNR